MHDKLNNKKILVTGCAGFIPSFVVERLLENNASVIGIDDLSSGSLLNMQSFLNHKNFQFVKGSICNKRTIESLVKKVDYIYHTAVRGIGISVQEPLKELKVNIEGTLLILEAIRKHGIEKFIYTSSASVYGNIKHLPEKETDPTMPLSPYGVSKLAAERYCLVYYHVFKLPIICLRYFNTYGPRQRKDSTYGGVVSIFIEQAINNKPLTIYGNGNQTRDFTYIDDTVNATIRAFEADDGIGKVINISAGKEYTVNQLAEKIKHISGNNNLAINYIPKRLIDNVDRRFGDITLAKRILSYNPTTPLAKGLKLTYNWNIQTYRKK